MIGDYIDDLFGFGVITTMNDDESKEKFCFMCVCPDEKFVSQFSMERNKKEANVMNFTLNRNTNTAHITTAEYTLCNAFVF